MGNTNWEVGLWDGCSRNLVSNPEKELGGKKRGAPYGGMPAPGEAAQAMTPGYSGALFSTCKQGFEVNVS